MIKNGNVSPTKQPCEIQNDDKLLKKKIKKKMNVVPILETSKIYNFVNAVVVVKHTHTHDLLTFFNYNNTFMDFNDFVFQYDLLFMLLGCSNKL